MNQVIDIGSRDLWWEAREHTRSLGQKAAAPSLIKTFAQSLPGQPTRMSFAAVNLGREKSALVIDLNKYRPGRDLKKYVDAGVDAFILRMGGPTQWVEGDYRYQEDATWRPYMEQVEALGMLNRVAGYWINNPFEDWALNGIISNVALGCINEWTSGGYMPPSFICDHEVAETWRGATKIPITAYNLVRSLGETCDKVWKQWKKPVSIYTARWFVDRWAKVEHVTYFDNINKPENEGGPGKQRGVWLAWYAQQFQTQYANLELSLDDLIIPTGSQEANLLSIGSNSKADIWQYTSALKLPGDTVGVDASVSLGTKEEFFTQFGLSLGTVPPVEPPPTGDGGGDPVPQPVDLKAVLDALAQMQVMLDRLETGQTQLAQTVGEIRSKFS